MRQIVKLLPNVNTNLFETLVHRFTGTHLKGSIGSNP